MLNTSTAASPQSLARQIAGRIFKSPPGTRKYHAAGDDWALWALACTGDAASAKALVQALSPQAYAMALQLLRKVEDAQDVVQEAFLRLWGSQAVDSGSARLSSFFNTIVINRCKTLLVQRREWGADTETWTALADAQQQSEPDAHDLPVSPQQLALALAQLPARQRMALAMWAYADAEVAQIAKAFELDVNAAHQLLHRAKTNLRHTLENGST